jgi:hypothetical protein
MEFEGSLPRSQGPTSRVYFELGELNSETTNLLLFVSWINPESVILFL